MKLTREHQQVYLKALDAYLRSFENQLAGKKYGDQEFYSAVSMIQWARRNSDYEPFYQITDWINEAAEKVIDACALWDAETVDLYEADKKTREAQKAVENVRAILDFLRQ